MELLLMVLLFLTATFLILLVLVQRGRGGGLAGAFGGLGGQSAFGTKAGDLFTRITIGVAAFWIVLCAFSVWYFSVASRGVISRDLGRGANPPASSSPKDSKSTQTSPDAAKSSPAKETTPAGDGANAQPPAASTPPASQAPGGNTPEKTP